MDIFAIEDKCKEDGPYVGLIETVFVVCSQVDLFVRARLGSA